MRFKMFALVLVVFCVSFAATQAEPAYRDIFPDTWVATDAIGRTMPEYSTVGPVKTDQRRVVGIFYITWHTANLGTLKSPYTADVTKILAADPKARMDTKNPLWTEGSCHWGEPEMGYFLSQDVYVIRKDISMLSDAGVDVLVMDVTNAVRYWDEWEVLFTTMQKMKAEGNKVPQFIFWCFNGPCITVVQDIYERIYKEKKYEDLWFYWDGKPLMLYNAEPDHDANGSNIQHPNLHYDAEAKTNKNNPHYGDPFYTEEFYKDYSKEVKDFFTLRDMWWGYYEWGKGRFVGAEDRWSFGYDLGNEKVKALKPEELVSKHQGKLEEAAVTPAQHPISLTGKCWTRENGEPELNEYDLPVPTFVPWLGKTVEHPEGYGIYFQQRWDEALQVNPQFLYINDWNEWTAGKYSPPEGQTVNFMRRANTFHFVDQYNSEFNRCLHPMKDGYTDNYYMQMAQNIRKYKGIRPIPELKGPRTLQIDGKFEDWNKDFIEFRDTIGDTIHRDHPGYGGLQYKNDSGRNDIITCKTGIDDKTVAFFAETNANLTPHTDPNWMLLFIDTDQNASTGWCGYDYMVNNKIKDDKTTTLMKYDATNTSNPWVEKAELSYRYSGKQLEVAIPREALGIKAGDTVNFDFHWCDNPADLKDAISLCVNGDSAPNRRFNYRAIWKKS